MGIHIKLKVSDPELGLLLRGNESNRRFADADRPRVDISLKLQSLSCGREMSCFSDSSMHNLRPLFMCLEIFERMWRSIFQTNFF